jgi:NAD(P)-dependent dehydrogenase (short-subunit alcohol dehydrogenase family)
MNHKNYQAPDNLLAGRVIAITGAGDGIGKQAAKTFATKGAEVILIGKTVQKLEQTYDEIIAAGGSDPAIFSIDLEGATEQDYDDMANAIDTEFGRLDGLLHNAGQLGQRAPLINHTLVTWNKVMQVNVTAEFMMTKALMPLLEASKDASLLFTTSSVGRKGRAYWGAYAISKFAVEGMAQVLADELENTTNIRVNCINPGATSTAMRATAYPAENPSSINSPAEIMATYLYLMGPDSKKVNGQSLDAY